MKQLLFTVIVTIVIVTSGTPNSYAHEQSNSLSNSVYVSGRGGIQAEPDQAVLNVSVTALEANLTTAKKIADERYKSVLAVIKTAGIPDKQVNLIQLSMQPDYDWQNGEQRYKGERVTRSLSITVKNLEKVADLMQALVENKVSTVDNMATGFQNRRELVMQALGLATQDAKEKAQYLAKQLDRKLGEPISITEQNIAPLVQAQQFDLRSKSASFTSSSAPPSESFGTQRIEASVSIRYELD